MLLVQQSGRLYSFLPQESPRTDVGLKLRPGRRQTDS